MQVACCREPGMSDSNICRAEDVILQAGAVQRLRCCGGDLIAKTATDSCPAAEVTCAAA